MNVQNEHRCVIRFVHLIGAMAVLGAMLTLTGCTTVALDKDGRSPVTEVTTQAEFNRAVLIADRPVLVIFHSLHCPFCKLAMGLQLPGWVDDYRGKVDFVTVEINQGPELRETYGVVGVPAYLFFKKGQIQKRITGYRPALFINGSFKALLKP